MYFPEEATPKEVKGEIVSPENNPQVFQKVKEKKENKVRFGKEVTGQ